jgi:hypothetical protein
MQATGGKGARQFSTIITLTALNLGELSDQFPLTAIEVVVDSLPLGVEAQTASALAFGGNPEVRDEFANSQKLTCDVTPLDTRRKLPIPTLNRPAL